MVKVVVHKWQVIGAGTAYSVAFETKDKKYRPIACGRYATVTHSGDFETYSVSDFFRTESMDKLPAMSDERWNTFRRHHKACDRLAYRIACRAFPELIGLGRLPTLWANWNCDKDTVKRVAVNVRERDML